MLISIKDMGGILPRQVPHDLQNFQAQIAENTKLWTNRVEPFRGNAVGQALSKIGTKRTIHKYSQIPGSPDSGFWFHWLTDVHVVNSPVDGDVNQTVYYTGDGTPKMTFSSIATAGGTAYPTNSYELGIPTPSNGMTVTVSGTPGDAENKQIRSYAIIYVSATGEKGPPSQLTASADFWEGNTVDLTSIPVAPTGNYNIATKQIFRTATGNVTDLNFVAEIPVSQTTYTDTVLDTQLGESLESENWFPPLDDLHGLGGLANGILYGFSKNRVCFSESYVPSAWSPLNRVNTNYDIVGGGHFDNTVVALTEKNPYLITGYDPRSMTADELNIDQGCVSARSIVNSNLGVIYASPNGLFLISRNGYTNLTEQYYTADLWQTLNPDSIYGVMHEDRYYGFYDNGTEQGCFLLDPARVDIGLVTLNTYATAAYSDPLTHRLYLVNGDTADIFDQGTSLTYRWKSKKYYSTHPTHMTAARVYADTYENITLNLYVDSQLKYSKRVRNGNVFRMPGGYREREFEIEVLGNDTLHHIECASTPVELAYT